MSINKTDARMVVDTDGQTVSNKLGNLSVFVNVKSYGAKGDGATDDTAAFVSAVASNKTIVIPTGTYKISNLLFTSLTNVKIIGIGKPIIRGTDQTKKIISFDTCTNIHLEGFSIGYDVTPTTRVDNIIPIHATKCTKTKIVNVEVFNSVSAGILQSYCNHAHVEGCYVHDTLADGINFSHCGRNVKALNNTCENTADDSIAVYFFQTADNTLVGEPDKFTKRVIIQGNDIKDSKARGILIGGTFGAVITGNTIDNTRAYGITVHYESSAVNYNQDFTVSNNVIRNAAQNGTDPNGQNAGIYVAQNNVRGSIKNNEIYNPKDKGIHCKGNADIKGNSVQTTGQGAYLGDWDSSSTSYGEFSGNTIISTTLEGVYIAPRSTRGWTVKNNEFIDCVDPANVATAIGVVRCTTTGGLNVTDNVFNETRGTQTLNSGVYLTGFGTAIVERNTLKTASGYSRGVLDLSSTGTIVNLHTERFSVIPTFGYWKTGDKIEKTDPSLQGTAGSQYIVDGWRRLTNGTGNVLGTDWVEMRITTGT